MRRDWFLVLLILSSGCAGARPTMAGSRWANALHDADPRVRKKAAFTLCNIGASDAAVLPALIGALRDADSGVRREAILALLKYGPGVEPAVPALTAAEVKDPDARVRACAAKALKKLQTEG
jgi:HEAT repeat protein